VLRRPARGLVAILEAHGAEAGRLWRETAWVQLDRGGSRQIRRPGLVAVLEAHGVEAAGALDGLTTDRFGPIGPKRFAARWDKMYLRNDPRR